MDKKKVVNILLWVGAALSLVLAGVIALFVGNIEAESAKIILVIVAALFGILALMVGYLAYMDTLAAPTGVIAADGIFLEYAPFEKYTAKGENAAFLIEHEKNMIPSLMKYFESRPKKVLEYWYDNSMYSRWKKPPAKFVLRADAMREDINGYRELGFDSISTFACFLGDDYENLYGEVDVKPFGECFD